MTLLELVQEILNDTEGDEVSSIGDTWEATQTAYIIRDVYRYLITTRFYPHLHTLFQLESSSDSSKPTHMRLPENIIDLEEVKYNWKLSLSEKDKFTKVTYLSPEDFIELADSKDSTAANVDVITDFSGITINVNNDRQPQYYTTIDDTWIIFDSYYSTLDSILASSKTKCTGYKTTELVIDDTTVLDFPARNLPLLISECKAKAFVILKQTANPKEEQQARHLKTWLAKEKRRTQGKDHYPDYGRK